MTRKSRVAIEELMAYPYQCLRDSFETLESLKSVPKFMEEPPFQNSRTIVVDTAEKMKACALHLSSDDITELAFDVEAYNANKYKQATCLLQLCTNLKDEYVIDVLAPGVWDEVSLLQDVFAKSSVVKIGHGISGIDIPCLHRDFGIFVINAFDTLEAATRLRLKGHLSLAKLCRYYNLPEDSERHSKLKELYQNCDWRERPLKEDQIEYGILDVRYLIQLRRLLIRDILEYDTVPHLVTNAAGQSSSECISPLKLSRDVSSNSHSVIGGVDSMDVEVDDDDDDNDNEEDNDIGQNSISCLTEEGELAEGGEEDKDDDDDDDDHDDHDVDNDDDNVGCQVIEMTSSLEEDENSFFTAHDENDGKSQSTAGSKISELRYHQLLMDVLKSSQQKCLSLWTEKSEPFEKNEVLHHMMTRADRIAKQGESRNQKVWTEQDLWLYKELVEWREDVAKKIGIMPSMVCPLNLLVLVAYKRPGSLMSLRRLNYFLPDIFASCENHSHHLEDLFSVVAGAGAENDMLVNTDAVVRLYSERQPRRKVKSPMPMPTNSSNDSTLDKDDDGITSNNTMEPSCATEQQKSTEQNHNDDDDNMSMSNLVKRINVYGKLSFTAAVASIAIFWVRIIKRRK
jgi:ribonuclease D